MLLALFTWSLQPRVPAISILGASCCSLKRWQTGFCTESKPEERPIPSSTSTSRHSCSNNLASSPGSSSSSSSSPRGVGYQVFQKLGSKWWDPNGPFGALHDFNPYRLSFIYKNAMSSPLYTATTIASSSSSPHLSGMVGSTVVHDAGPLHGLRVLDVGCGGGLLSEALATEGGATVTAIDIEEAGIAASQYHLDQKLKMEKINGSVEYKIATVQQIAQEIQDGRRKLVNSTTAPSTGTTTRTSSRVNDPGFDIVVASEVAEHVDDVDDFVHALARCCKPDGAGTVIITTINQTPESLLLGIVMAEYIVGCIPKGTHEWSKFIKPEKLTSICCDGPARLRHLETKGLLYLPMLRTYLTDPFKRIQYMAAYRSTTAYCSTAVPSNSI